MTWTPPIWVRVVLLIGLAAREIYFNQSEALSHIWVMARHQYGISLLVPQASFRVALRNVGCVFRLRRLRSSEILVSRSVSGKTKQITWHGDKQCDCCSRSLLLLTPTTWFSLVRNRNRNAKSELNRNGIAGNALRLPLPLYRKPVWSLQYCKRPLIHFCKGF